MERSTTTEQIAQETLPVVLIVEDNRDDYFLLERAFCRSEIPTRLQWAADGAEARAYLRGDAQYTDRSAFPLPALILSDLKMPRLDGFELLGWVRAQHQIKCLTFVVLTSSSQLPDIDRAYEAGANSYLVKPTRFEDLLEISDVLKSYWLVWNRPSPARPAGGE